jgi:hypothetical protein
MLHKKQRERRQVDRLLSQIAALGECVVVEREEPDFALHYSHKSVGLEVTQLYRPAAEGTIPHQIGEANRQQIAKLVQCNLNREAATGLVVTVFFYSGFSPAKSTVAGVAAEISRYVVAAAARSGENVEIECGPEIDRLPTGLERIIIRRVLEFDDCFCSAPDGGFVPELRADLLQSIIAIKEARLSHYEQGFDEQWLVVVVDTIAYATWYTASRSALAEVYRTDFDKIFVLWELAGRVEELRCARSA